ncbi:MAG TPA: hypothetical protein VEC99_11550 [Clostridia bacterium]|nr:hypothetical protein [Clostridia bacterium]
MKTLGLVLGIAATLCTSTLNTQAHGRWHGGGFWPIWGFGLGLGLGTALSYREYPSYYTYYPSYTYTYPSYAYNPPANPPQPATPPPAATPSAAPAVSQDPTWVPSTPGTGKWVPDPQPYRYQPAKSFRPAVTVPTPNVEVVVTQRVNFATSPGGVPLTIISR